MKRVLFIAASIMVSGFFLWLAFRNVDLSSVLQRIQSADPLWVLIAFVFVAGSLITRAVRWQGMLDFRARFWRCFHILNLGFMLNLVPLRLGELARSLLIAREGVPFVTAATSVVLERMLDTLLVVILVVFTVATLPSVPPEISATATTFGVAVVAAFTLLIIFARFPAFGHRVLEAIERPFPFLKRLGLNRLFDHVLDGLKPLTHLRSAIHVIVWTIIAWASSFVTVYALVRGVNLTAAEGAPLTEGATIAMSLLTLALAAFSIAIPLTVGGVGPFQGAVLIAGLAVGVPQDQALALGVLFQGINVLGYAVWGVIALLTMGVSLGDILNRPSAATAEGS